MNRINQVEDRYKTISLRHLPQTYLHPTQNEGFLTGEPSAVLPWNVDWIFFQITAEWLLHYYWHEKVALRMELVASIDTPENNKAARKLPRGLSTFRQIERSKLRASTLTQNKRVWAITESVFPSDDRARACATGNTSETSCDIVLVFVWVVAHVQYVWRANSV